jgi:Ca-activated chloride channel family protein
MKKTPLLLALITYNLLFITASHALPFASQLNRGNGLYDRGLFDRAQNVYEGMLAKKNDPLAKYNLGNALYRQGKFADAEKAFAAVSGEAGLAPRALYNLGNAEFRQEDYEGAVRSYEDALKAKPNDEDTLYNLALAKKLLNLPKQQRPKQNKQDKKQGQRKQKPQPKDQDKKQPGQRKQRQQNKQGMNKEDANRILQSIGNNEKHKGKQVNGRGAGGAEDW